MYLQSVAVVRYFVVQKPTLANVQVAPKESDHRNHCELSPDEIVTIQ